VLDDPWAWVVVPAGFGKTKQRAHGSKQNNKGVFMRTSSRAVQCSLLGALIFLVASSIELRAQKQPTSPSVEALLPSDGTTADVMQMTYPRGMDELTKKLAQAIAKNPDWWAEHVKKAKPGQPVAYDVRLGLTQEEYTEYLSLSKKAVFKKVKTAKLNVKRNGERVVLSFDDRLPNLKPIELDLKADVVITTYGTAADRSQITASEAQKATGPWDGVQWKLVSVEEKPARSTSIQFALGKLKESGRGILYYNVSQVSEQSRVNVYYVFQYDFKRDR
jgi:hypothetical protein